MRNVFCEACKRAVTTTRELHVTDDGRMEHRVCATGRAATVMLRAERGTTQRWTKRR